MKIPTWIKELAFSVLDKEFILEKVDWDEQTAELKKKLDSCYAEKNLITTKNAELNLQNEELAKQIVASQNSFVQQSEVDVYCKRHYTQIPMIAYKQKRGFLGKKYTVALGELITPDSWEVHNFLKGVDFQGHLPKVSEMGTYYDISGT